MSYASGKRAYGISDRSGRRYRLRDMKREWNGSLVGPDEFEPKHPQLFPIRSFPDPQALRNPRPESNLSAQRSVTYGYNPVGSPTQPHFPPNEIEATGFVGSVTIVSNQVVTNVPSGDSDTFISGVTGSTSVGSVTVNAAAAPDTTYTVTVVGGNPSNHPYYNVGSTNKYAINGSTATADVTLSLSEGSTYRFDQSDSSNSGHPLRFSTTANGTHSYGGTEYTTGVTTNGTPGSSGAYTQITVASGAPTLYYYCSVHSGMGGQANTP